MITIKEVAKEAGVAVGTVSRVINNKNVKPTTKKKVEEAINRLGYKVDNYARGLKLKKSYTIAIILPTIWDPFFSEFTYYVEDHLSKKGYKLMICNSDGNPKKELEYIQMAQQNKVDGIIAITYSDIDDYIMANLPIVSIDRHFKEDIAYVTSDNIEGGRIAAQQLIQKGCTKVAFVSSGSSIENETMNRKKAFELECNALGMEPTIYSLTEPIADLDKELERFVKEYIVETKEKIDGIFVVTDVLAIRLIKVMKQYGIRVPEDIQVIGYDGIKMQNDLDYAVSSIRQPVPLMAKKAVEVLIAIVQNKNVIKRNVLSVEFVEGGTTKTTTIISD